MPHPCVVCGRSRMNPHNREEEYMFFGFPVNDEARCRKWLEFCCREDLYKLTKKQLLQRMVCSKHFEKRDFLNEYLDRLNCTAVPSIYDPKQSLYNISCVICGRSRRDPTAPDFDDVTFHHFPGEEFRCLTWLDFVGVDSYYRLTRKEILFCYICSKHFDPSQFMSGYMSRLVDHAVPNIRNPDQLDHSDEYIVEVPKDSKSHVNQEKPKKLEPLTPAVLESKACVACGRSRSDPRNKLQRYKFHPFPAYEIGRCLKWCQFLGREDILKMSPNQIRKLVLCSKHFQIGQSFHKVGPCDAVPTIKDVTETNDDDSMEQMEEEQGDLEEFNCAAIQKGLRKQGFLRPSVSSKKPKVDNKPTPLAKKRGKSKRPTLINIPRLEPSNIGNRVIRKLPLPPAPNWKIQFSDQYQPITITNNIASSMGNSIPSNIKKVILPFTGDISNLGAPIPVNSLSSIPPGLLIKINLPEQEQQKPAKPNKRQSKAKIVHTPTTPNVVERREVVWLKNGQEAFELPMKQDPGKELVEYVPMSLEETEDKHHSEDRGAREDVVLPHSLEVLDEEAGNIKAEQYYRTYDDMQCVSSKPQKSVRRKKWTGTMRRTIFPIRSEVKYFLRKIAPHMHRLPRKARAQIKLSIVNQVIEQL